VLDTDGSILRVNPEFTRIFGYAEEEAPGRPINELVVPEELWAEAEEYTRRGTRESCAGYLRSPGIRQGSSALPASFS
jgi:PAS domain S-box-containing protein